MVAETKAKFITFEGIDGAGKSSHIEWFAQALRARGHAVVLTREPGGTPLGEKLREIVLHDAMHSATEALLVFAARQEHVLQVIQPALARGDWVLCDRFTDATFAYQGYGRQFSLAKLTELERWVHADLQPDLTIVFECAPAVAAARLAKARAADKFEAESEVFFTLVSKGYQQRASENPARFRLVNSEQTPDAVRAALAKILEAL
jgi:dTMP kinase